MEFDFNNQFLPYIEKLMQFVGEEVDSHDLDFRCVWLVEGIHR